MYFLIVRMNYPLFNNYIYSLQHFANIQDNFELSLFCSQFISVRIDVVPFVLQWVSLGLMLVTWVHGSVASPTTCVTSCPVVTPQWWRWQRRPWVVWLSLQGLARPSTWSTRWSEHLNGWPLTPRMTDRTDGATQQCVLLQFAKCIPNGAIYFCL